MRFTVAAPEALMPAAAARDLAAVLRPAGGGWLRLVALALLPALACSDPPSRGDAGGGGADPGPSEERDDAREVARREMEELVRGMNAAIDTWDGPGYVTPLDRTPAMIFIGSDASEVSLGYDEIAPEILSGFERARQGGRAGASYSHTGLIVGAERDGSSAWWVQSMDYGFEHEGVARRYPFRISGFALRGDEGLRVVLAHASLPLREEEDFERLARPVEGEADEAEPEEPRAGLTEEGAVGVRALARELAARRNAGDWAGWLALIAEEADVLVIGAGLDTIHAGRGAVAEFARGAQPAAGPGSEREPLLLSDSLVVHARGDHGWWYESGRLRRGEGAETRELPWRLTGAAIRRDAGWRVLLLHEDVPVPNDSTAAFSVPADG